MEQGLRRLRFPPEESRGRRYPEPLHPYRNPFQRDRDRIIHARAFRRLENKTQVFASGLSDHFRNRLTHTIEVTQLSRTVASVLELDEALAEALALGHDIGHPPFAHAGEGELHRQMAIFGDGFDHNRHALRLVERFEQKYPMFPGLNLTFEVREGIVKHSRDIEPGEAPDLDEYLPGLRPPLEAQLIDLADEVAYNIADLDDGYSALLFSPEEACAATTRMTELFETVEMQFPGAPERVRFHEVCRRLMDWLVSGLIVGTREAAAHAGVETSAQVRQFPRRIACYTSETRLANAAIKEFLHRRLYESEALREERRLSVQRMGELFQYFLAHPKHLPPAYLDEMPESPLHRIVCDYIAGMTDRFFMKTYLQLLGG